MAADEKADAYQCSENLEEGDSSIKKMLNLSVSFQNTIATRSAKGIHPSATFTLSTRN